MFRLALVFSCFCFIGCHHNVYRNPTSFKERQEQLFYNIDHELLFENCQKLMRLHRQGKLSDNKFFYDDSVTKLNELPEYLRALEPTSVQVFDMWVDISFFNEDGMQSLQGFSNEFGPPGSSFGDTKGLGFRKEPFNMDKLSGKESLDDLNEKYDHFQIEIFPCLTYHVFHDQQPASPEEVKQDVENMDFLLGFMTKIMDELVIKKQRLLYQTDHNELLKACRQTINDYNNGVFSADKIDINEENFTEDQKHIPKIILDLEPVYVWFDKDRVMVALIGGLDHSGVIAYMDGEKAETRDDVMDLIGGLQYYDDGIRDVGDDYKEYLKSLKNEAISYLDWKRKQENLPVPNR